jgi:hypothetical protein
LDIIKAANGRFDIKSRLLPALMLAVLIPGTSAAQQNALHHNWLLNAGAETQPVTSLGWRAISGDWSTMVPGAPAANGQAFLGGGQSARAELVQEVSLAALGSWLAGGRTKAELRGYLSSWNDEADTGEMVLEVLGADGKVLFTTTTGPRSYDAWTLVTVTAHLPAAAAMLRVRLVSVRVFGPDNDGVNTGSACSVLAPRSRGGWIPSRTATGSPGRATSTTRFR